MRILDWQALGCTSGAARRAGAAAALARRRRAARARAARDHRRGAARRRCGAARATRASSIGVSSGRSQVAPRNSRPRAAQLTPEQVAGARARDRQCRALSSRTRRRARLAVDTQPGVRCEQLIRPIQAVGLYVPAGSAPLPSTVIMLAVPARIAGCPRACCARRRDRDGSANPAVLVAARAVRHRHGLQGRRRAGHRRDGLWHRQRSRRSTRSSAPATPGSPPPSSSCASDPEGAALRSAGRTFRGAGDRR